MFRCLLRDQANINDALGKNPDMIAVLAYYSLILVKNESTKICQKCLESYHKSLIREPYILL